ncbi:DMT family transporter [Fulvimonas sp. R45]|uniref:DMT family transporter n=1 Tax=Fulvimonas sp. R45 TaxID=3045937 RepID=UPI00265EB5B5|nr:DMT family transporter [Fulvimonas sp. R45]MDO1527290.1 DMT family transporter [Fulvimonas sp. R45]
MSNRHLAYLCLAGAMVTVGSTVVASKVIGAGLPPFTATVLRFVLALPVFVLLMRATSTPWPRPDRHDALLLCLQAVCGSVGYTACLIAGTRLAPAAEAGIVIGTLPAVAALTAAVLLRERLARRTLATVALATGGVLVVALAGGGTGGAHSLRGDALVLAAVLCESLFILLNKRLHVPLPPLALSTAMAALGLLGALPPALLETARQPPHFPVSALLGVTYYALVPTVAGFWLWYAGAARVSGAEASLFTAIAPAAGVLLSALVLGERVGLPMLAGLGLVIAAVMLQAWPRRVVVVH